MIRKHIKKHALTGAKVLFWFLTGVLLGTFLFVSFSIILFQKLYSATVYPGIIVNGIDLGGKTKQEVKEIFTKKNEEISNVKFTFKTPYNIATVSASQIDYGYDEDLIATQTMEIGRSKNFFSDIISMSQAYFKGLSLSTPYKYSGNLLDKIIDPLTIKLYKEPIDAVFSFENGRATAFKQSEDGQTADIQALKNSLALTYKNVTILKQPQVFVIPIKILKPKVSTDQVNNLGIKELIGQGESLFQHSIQSRVFNITLAASRLNGILIAPDDTFSFNNALGDISAFTGYKQAYIIQNGKTILGDGGGVCQVSTTFFRTALKTGLPMIERHAHAYRVGYYEQDSPPGLDATIYSPTVDLKFKNDTKHHILIQTQIDQGLQKLTVSFFGTKDNRIINISKPIVTNTTSALPSVYRDDPTLAKGVIKQIDFAAGGAKSTFTREVIKDGKIAISDTFVSNFRPWAAVYLRGTKE